MTIEELDSLDPNKTHKAKCKDFEYKIFFSVKNQPKTGFIICDNNTVMTIVFWKDKNGNPNPRACHMVGSLSIQQDLKYSDLSNLEIINK